MIASACSVLAPLAAPADCVALVHAGTIACVILAAVVIVVLAAHARR